MYIKFIIVVIIIISLLVFIYFLNKNKVSSFNNLLYDNCENTNYTNYPNDNICENTGFLQYMYQLTTKNKNQYCNSIPGIVDIPQDSNNNLHEFTTF